MARSLPLKAVARQIKQANGQESTDPAQLPPGFMQLYSFYKPSLVASNYSVDAVQVINAAKNPELTITNYFTNPPAPIAASAQRPGTFSGVPSGKIKGVQNFEVVAPQFSLPDGVVHSCYPPDGHQDEGRVLPHLVFNDPHLPWERWCGTSVVPDPTGTVQLPTNPAGLGSPLDQELVDAGIKDSDGREQHRLQVPWMAIVVFDPEELTLSPPDLSSLASALTTPNSDEIKRAASTNVAINTASGSLSPTGSYPMMVQDYVKLPVGTRPNYEASPSEFIELKTSSELMKVIFPTQQKVKSIFGDLSKHKYLAHVRNINTVGMPDAGVEDVGLFSIVVSHRTGPVALTMPKTQVAHLVSIEHLDTTFTQPNFAADPNARIGLVSLYSWVYTALPPNPVNFVDAMIKLGNEKQYLKPTGIPDQDPVSAATPKWGGLPLPLIQRLRKGYIFTRYRTQTGEETVAINRGPLLPVRTPPAAATWPGNSNYSTDYQILDKELGVVDISYSSAFQLGKTLAIADRTFCQALMRLRAIIFSNAASETFHTLTKQQSKMELGSKIVSHVEKMTSLSKESPVNPVKWVVQEPKDLAPPLDHPIARPILNENIKKQVLLQASAGDGLIYNEFNLGNNSDWAVVHAWISDLLFLDRIPAQYLFVDPSHLQMESLRFFHIDDTWMDCLIDGALSVANHLDQGDDTARRHMKMAYNEYLTKGLPPAGKVLPQIPCWGFFIRSTVIKAFPDLKISIVYNSDNSQPDALLTSDGRARICQLTNLDETTLLCLLDREPEEIIEIQFSQPHHQQRFSLGEHLDAKSVEFGFRQLYTDKNKIPVQDPHKPDAGWPVISSPTYINGDTSVNAPKPIYDWPSRCIHVDALADTIQKYQFQDSSAGYSDKIANSVVMGFELNDPIYYLRLDRPANPNSKPRPTRQLYIGTDPGPASLPLDPTVPEIPPVGTTPGPPVVSPTPTGPPVPDLPRFPSNPAQVSVVTQNVIGQPNTPGFPVGTNRAHFLVAVYPDYATSFPAPFDANHTIATENLYLCDLIFSIRRDHPADPQINDALREIIINIPINGPQQTGEPLLENYDGPGARMLSNLRYNVVLNRSPTTLQCRVLPRGKVAQTIDDGRTDELSFKLSECYISPIKHPTSKQPVGGQGPLIKDIGICVVQHIESYQQGGKAVFVTPINHEVYKAKRTDIDPANQEPL